MFTEGLKTEPDYLMAWRHLHRSSVHVTVSKHHGAPKTLVDLAADDMKRERYELKRGRGCRYDEIWCMFDVNSHPNLLDAYQKALANGIRLAVSNPCIELWFALHFEDQTAYLSRYDAQRKSRHHLQCDKNLTEDARELLVNNYEIAKQRAKRLETLHKSAGRASGANPS